MQINKKGQIIMVSNTEEICGSFAVLTEQLEIKKIVVIQDALSYYAKEKSYSKKFRLEPLNGVSVSNRGSIYFSPRQRIATQKNKSLTSFHPETKHFGRDRGAQYFLPQAYN